VHGLRRAIGVDRIETLGDGYRVRLEPEELDLARFERLVAAGEQALGSSRPAEAAEDLGAAVRLWQGPPLADLSDQPVARSAVPRLEELRLRGIELLIDARLALGEHEGLLAELETLVAEHPFHERLREQQILALYRSGRQKEALDAYRAARRVLVDELGVEPGPALQELERAILRQDDDLLAPPPQRPQLLRLPRPATTLVGRRLEVAAVAALLRKDDVRLLTLTGVGGTGKTRLALAVAEELAPELRDGAAFVDLSTIRTGEAVLPAIAHALGVGDAGDAVSVLQDRSLVLVLDNLEQIDDPARPILTLIDDAPRVRVLATSRVPLRISAEREYAVPPLPVPGDAGPFETLVSNDAIRLFALRAQAVDSDFALTDANVGHVAAVCRRLDGLPLAIELAAARSRVMPPAAIESRLTRALDLLVAGARDLPARQQTLRATLDWSYDLLTLGERQLLADVSVFAGGWTLADADAVIGRDTSLDLEGLIESGLVRRRGTPDEPRFVLLETIREYAVEKLGGAPDLRRAHALHFAEFAERSWSEICAGGEAETIGYEALGREHDNVLAAIDWADAAGDVELELRIAVATRWYWLVRGHLHEGDRVFQRLRANTQSVPALHGEALVLGAAFPWRLGDIPEAKRQLEEALSLFRELGDEDNIARSIAELGGVAVSEDDLDRAVELYEETAILFERLGRTVRLAVVLANLAAIAAQRNDQAAALEYGERAIAIQREIEDSDGISVSLANIARVRLAVGDDAGAARDLHEALAIAKRLKYRMVLAHALGAAGEIAVRAGEADRATRLLGAARQAFADLGVPMPDEEADEQARTLARVAATTDGERIDMLLRDGAAIAFEDAVDDALSVTAR
jgi:predicted ATPase